MAKNIESEEYWHKKYAKVLKENDELKETINELKTYDDEDFIESGHINKIYTELGFMGVINYAKDKLQTYGVVREEEEGLWVLATGGWSDNEHWIHCLNSPISLFRMKHYAAYQRGGAHYYTEKPYQNIKIILERPKVLEDD